MPAGMTALAVGPHLLTLRRLVQHITLQPESIFVYAGHFFRQFIAIYVVATDQNHAVSCLPACRSVGARALSNQV
jgi:hypothetical protein